jgi:hypothetical protein
MNRIFKIDFNLFEITDIDSFIKNEKSFPLNVYKLDLGGHFGFEVTLGNKTVETIFDTLNAKAALFAIDLLFEETLLKYGDLTTDDN